MNRITFNRMTFCVVVALLFAAEPIQQQACARGFGGGFHGGGFGGGGFGGYHGGGFGGGYRGFGGGNFGDFRGGSYGGFNSFRSGDADFGQRQSIGYRGNDAGGFDNSVRSTGNWGGDAGRWNGWPIMTNI